MIIVYASMYVWADKTDLKKTFTNKLTALNNFFIFL